MGYSKVIEDMIEEKLLYLHTAFIGKVTKVYYNKDSAWKPYKADVQPLNMLSLVNGKTVKPAIIKDVPILDNAKYKLNISLSEKEDTANITGTRMQKGAIVFCLCAERDITETKKGKMVAPPIGHHQIKDCVIIGQL
ncbi:MAG: hypothetical protein IKK84_00175 [Clostridia bacterium]|nr:hypothetical protein [Clostridia bacterium]